MAESASAILACGEYLATAPEMPSDQRAAVDVLRREIRMLVYGLSVLTAVKARTHRIELTHAGERTGPRCVPLCGALPVVPTAEVRPAPRRRSRPRALAPPPRTP